MLPSDEDPPPGRTDLTVSVVWGVTPTSSPSCLRRPMPKPPATSARWTQGEVMDLEEAREGGLMKDWGRRGEEIQTHAKWKVTSPSA